MQLIELFDIPQRKAKSLALAYELHLLEIGVAIDPVSGGGTGRLSQQVIAFVKP